MARGVLVEGVNDLYGTLGLDKPDISLLDERFLAQIRAQAASDSTRQDQVKLRVQVR